jgi:uncharacterized protein YdhG (YjbR/CyaY superfamily)
MKNEVLEFSETKMKLHLEPQTHENILDYTEDGKEIYEPYQLIN